MQTEATYWQQCRLEIEAKLAWGASQTWQNGDFERLSEQIFAQTQVTLSVSTLRRLWGRVRYDHLPSVTTLNTLAQFAGYPNWRKFRQAVDRADDPLPFLVQPPTNRLIHRFTNWRPIVWISGSLILLALLGAGLFRSRMQPDVPARFLFDSRPVTRGIPNSVIFTYDATASPTDSVFVQQSWDPTRRQRVSKKRHQYTSLYYYPGSYQARLVVGRQIVSKHTLIIPTEGWLGLIDQKPVPIYLKKTAILEKGFLHISPETITAHGIALQPTPPAVQFYNVGNFRPVTTDDFTFSCQLQNQGGQGAGVCQHTGIALFTEGSAINIPLCRKGCISALTLFSIDTLIDGRTATYLSLERSSMLGFVSAVRGTNVRFVSTLMTGWLMNYPLQSGPAELWGWPTALKVPVRCVK